MAQIFLSHSSRDEREAVALKQWLENNGWNDVFLDIDPRRGLAAGERWQEALRQAADRCEAVVFIVSSAWAASKWCLAEFLLAKSLHKLIFCVVIEDLPFGELPIEMTAEWQLCPLFGHGSTDIVHFSHWEAPQQVAFLSDGLSRLRNGLRKAGLTAEHFKWPPVEHSQRSPYRALEPFDSVDAAVYFGRDVEILRGLDVLRGMRENKEKKLLVILGASGAGKSSYLNAGLLPRLARDDRHFFPLTPIRPECAAISGERGLARVLHLAAASLGLSHIRLSDIKTTLRKGRSGLLSILRRLISAACGRLVGLPDDALPPTLVLSVDQAEELFNVDAGDEAAYLLELIGDLLRTSSDNVPLIVAFTIRSDRYEPLQTSANLSGLQSVVFDDLKPMRPTRFREVITGPAGRATDAGHALVVEPALVERLVADCCEGGDTLPLLSLTLARLYDENSHEGKLLLGEYEAMGGLANIIRTEAESLLDKDVKTREVQIDLLHAAFIPWLATINPVNDRPMRRQANLIDLPQASLPLIGRLIDKRLLLIDQRDGLSIVEVAHEALLRQWDLMSEWLDAERGDLKDADVLERAAEAWRKSGCKDAWLIEGERLAIAEELAAKPRFGRRLMPAREFLVASRRRDDAKREHDEMRGRKELEAARELAAEQLARTEIEKKARLDAENSATQLRAGRRGLVGALAAVALVAVVAASMFIEASQSEQQAVKSSHQWNALRLAAESQAMLSGDRIEGDERAFQQLLAANLIVPGIVNTDLLNVLIRRRPLLKLVSGASFPGPVAISPDLRFLATTSSKKTLRLWDAKSGQPLGNPLKGNSRDVRAIAFSPDGTTVVSGGSDNALYLLNVSTGKMIGEPFVGHESDVLAVSFSSDGTRIVSGSSDTTLRIWDSKTSKAIGAPLKGHISSVTSVAFSPDGSVIVSGSSDGALHLWNSTSGQALGAPLKRSMAQKAHYGAVVSVAFSPDGDRVVSGGEDKTIVIWDVAFDKSVMAEITGHEAPISSLSFSPNGDVIVSAAEDETVRLWNAWTGTAVGETLRGHRGKVKGAAFSPDGEQLISVGVDDKILFWDATAHSTLSHVLGEHQSFIFSVAISKDGKLVATGGLHGSISLWNANENLPVALHLKGNESSVKSVAFHPNKNNLASGGNDNELRLWDIKNIQAKGQPFLGHKSAVTSIAFSPDGSHLASGSMDNTVRLWNTTTGLPAGNPLKGHRLGVNSIAYSPDGSRVLSGSDDGTLRLWNVETRQAIGPPLQGHSGGVNAVAFSADGALFASGGIDNTLRIWDSQSGRAIGEPLKGHNGSVQTVAFSPDGATIVSGGTDKVMRLWDVKARQLIGAPLEGHERTVTSVTFSPDGTHIISGSEDSTLRVWPAPKSWHGEICAKLSRNMSRLEWRQWVSPDIDYQCQCPGLPIAPDDPSDRRLRERCPGSEADSNIFKMDNRSQSK